MRELTQRVVLALDVCDGERLVGGALELVDREPLQCDIVTTLSVERGVYFARAPTLFGCASSAGTACGLGLIEAPNTRA